MANALCVDFGLAVAKGSDMAAVGAALAHQFEGDFLRIVRYDARRIGAAPTVLVGTAAPKSRWLVAPSAESLRNPLIAELPRRPRPGTVWSLADLRDGDPSDPDSLWRKLSIRYGLADVVTLVLDSTDGHLDVVEVFRRTASPSPQSETGVLMRFVAAVLADFWPRRSERIELELRHGTKANGAARDGVVATLSCDNPLHLTRCEFRICERIVRGLSVKRIAADLDISPHTVRSHLRNIFAKTGTDNQRALLVRLLEVDYQARTGLSLSA